MAAPGLPPQGASILAPNNPPKWASEAPQWSTLGIVRPEMASQLTEEEIVRQVMAKKQEAKAARRKTVEDKWQIYESSYNLEFRNPAKKRWQADLVVPDVQNTIFSWVSLLQDSLFSSSQWLRLIPYEQPYPDGYLRAVQGWTKYVMERGGFVEEFLKGGKQAGLLGTGAVMVSIDDFIRVTPRVTPPDPQAVQMAMMQGQPPPQPMIETQPVPAHQVAYRWVDIWNLYPDPYARSSDDWKYIVEESDVDREELEEKVMAGVYDSIDDIGEPWGGGTNAARGMESGYAERSTHANAQRMRDRVDEYTGNLYGPNGEVVAKNWIVTVVNEKAIVRIGPNPLWSGKSRYLWIRPLPEDDCIWGRSMIDVECEVQEEKSILLNLAIEDVHYAVMSIFLHDDDKSNEPVTLDSVYPGMVLHGREQFLSRVGFNSNTNAIWPVWTQLTNLEDRSTRFNEMLDGTPTSRGRPSAAESKIKAQSGGQYLTNLCDRLRTTALVPAIELTYEHLLQFGDDLSDPTVQEVISGLGGPPALADLKSRLLVLSHPFKIKAQGPEFLGEREEWMGRWAQLGQILMQFGLAQAAPNVMMRYAYIGMEALGVDPTTLALADNPESQAMMLMQMQQAASAPGGSLPNGEAAPGAGPTPASAPGPPVPSPAQPQM